MANTTLASTASGLETIDDFVGEYLSGFVADAIHRENLRAVATP